MAVQPTLADALTAEEVRELLRYEPDTGDLYWLPNKGGKRGGKKAGWRNGEGYLQITINDRHHMVHRIVWLHFYGRPPSKHLDHINGCRSDNRIANLREAERFQNNANARVRRDSRSQVKGVHLQKGTRKYLAQITKHGCVIKLGTYYDIADAKAAYEQAAKIYFGDFARTE